MSRQQVSIASFFAFLLFGAISAVLAQAAVHVAEHEEHGSYLVDSEGRSLYVFIEDAEADGSACNAACAAAWPPLSAEGDVTADEGVDGALLGTIERPDGSTQVTYDGWPLYRYLADRKAGSTAGQGQGDEWFLITPDGTLIGAQLQASQEGEAAGGEGAAVEEVDVDALMAEGRDIYRSMCAGCHGANGDEVLASHVRRITEAEDSVANAPGLIRQIIYGGAYMPPFGGALSNEQVQAIATYVRNSFGHDFGPVTGQEVVTERERFN